MMNFNEEEIETILKILVYLNGIPESFDDHSISEMYDKIWFFNRDLKKIMNNNSLSLFDKRLRCEDLIKQYMILEF